MFFSREGDWRDVSRDALIFATADEALKYAAEGEMSRSVRAVVRFREEKCHILLPLLGEFHSEAVGSRHGAKFR